jgi:hypothetical protein
MALAAVRSWIESRGSKRARGRDGERKSEVEKERERERERESGGRLNQRGRALIQSKAIGIEEEGRNRDTDDQG